MISMTQYARPYAQAVFAVATQHNQFQAWQSALECCAQAVGMPALSAMLKHPGLGDAVIEILKPCLTEPIEAQGIALLKLLCSRHRIQLFPEIFEQFQSLQQQAAHIQIVQVSSASTLTEAQKEKIHEACAGRLECSIELSCTVDTGLISGLLIRVGDLVIDGSVRGRLRSLAKTLYEE